MQKLKEITVDSPKRFEKFEQLGDIENISPLSQWPRWIRLMKKTGGRKSRWTVPYEVMSENLQ